MVRELYESRSLTNDEDWRDLVQMLANGQLVLPPLDAIINYLRDRAHARHVLIERDYIDRDHRAAVSLFYSRQFRAVPGLCTRFHFFKSPSPWTAQSGETPPSSADYLGYIVQRPTPESPIGRSVLAVSSQLIPGAHVYCSAVFRPHVNEAELAVSGVVFAQQDSIVMTCAETSMWTAARIMTKRYKHPLVLPTQIASLASDGYLPFGRTLPSSGLTPNQMAHGLTRLGFGTLYYSQDAFDAETAPLSWDAMAISVPYLLSSIPVILGVPDHAITACGVYAGTERTEVKPGRLRPTRDWLQGLMIQDDARGPFRIMPRTEATYGDLREAGLEDLLNPVDATWTCAEDVDSAIVPLPDRVYLTALDVEEFARQFLDRDGFPPSFETLLKSLANAGNPHSKMLIDALLDGAHGGIVYSTRCRRAIDVRRDFQAAHPRVRGYLRNTPMSRYVWSVEFTTHDLFTKSSPDDRLVLGELYLDATASHYSADAAVIFAHCAGMVHLRPGLCEGDLEPIGPEPILDDYAFYRPSIPLWTDA